MNSSDKMLGAGGTQLVVGVGPHTVESGCCANSCKVRVDATQIKSITPGDTVGETDTAVTNKSWESKALYAGIDYIYFDKPIVSITLNAETDSVMLYLQPLKQE